MGKTFWEKSYADLSSRPFGEPASEVIELVPLLPSGGRVLDLGCGDGRNAIPLAQAGFRVTAVDNSEAGISKLRSLAQGEGLVINAVHGDMNSCAFSGLYELVIAHGSLHLITRSEWTLLVGKMKAHTASGGWNAVTVFTDTVPAPPDLAAHCRGMFHEGELFDLYPRWDKSVQRSYTFNDEHEGGIRHTHSANKLVARKPFDGG